VTSCELALAAPYACSSLALAASLFGVARAVRALLLLTSHQTIHWCRARGARAPAPHFAPDYPLMSRARCARSCWRQFGIDKAVLPGERYWHG